MVDRGNGVYELRVSLGKDPISGKYRQVSRVFRGTKTAAVTALRKLHDEVERGRAGAVPITLAELVDEYMVHLKAQGRSKTTLEAYESIYRIHIVPVLGASKIGKIDSLTLDRFYSGMVNGGAGGSTVAKASTMLHGLFGQAVRWGMMPTNPAVNSRPPAYHQPETKIPTIEDVHALLDAAKRSDPDFHALLWLAVNTGLRRGELAGLQWQDVDLDLGNVTVRRGVVNVKGDVIVQGTKTHQIRPVRVDKSTVEVLRAHRTRCAEAASACGAVLDADSFVFSPRPGGTEPMRPDSISQHFERVSKRCGVKTSMHKLRHFHISHLVAGGADLKRVSVRAGHARTSITADIYAHVVADDGELADAFGRLLAN